MGVGIGPITIVHHPRGRRCMCPHMSGEDTLELGRGADWRIVSTPEVASR
jgi:hypothetical protein